MPYNSSRCYAHVREQCYLYDIISNRWCYYQKFSKNNDTVLSKSLPDLFILYLYHSQNHSISLAKHELVSTFIFSITYLKLSAFISIVSSHWPFQGNYASVVELRVVVAKLEVESFQEILSIACSGTSPALPKMHK